MDTGIFFLKNSRKIYFFTQFKINSNFLTTRLKDSL